ncbi:MAG: hypothetical protein ACETVU_05440 [Desulfatiglandales bacterium]
MSEQRYNEKEEEKRRDFGEWRKSDRGDAVGWGAGFIWGALVLLAQITNYAANFSWWNGWAVFFTGAGVIALSGVVIRQIIPKYPSPSIWDLLFGLFLLGIGSGGLIGDWFWVLVLFIIGVVILLSAFSRQR